MPSRLTLALALTSALLVAGCGGQETPAATAEKSFLQGMVPHHSSAVDMAKIAQTEAESDFVKGLARDIISSQALEIAQMGRIHQRLFDAPLEPAAGAHMDAAAMLRGKKPFDRAFVDEMTPHHQAAVDMSEEVLGKTQDAEVRRLAQGIIAAQKREIAEMKAFRAREYGRG